MELLFSPVKVEFEMFSSNFIIGLCAILHLTVENTTILLKENFAFRFYMKFP